jgi:hypothetical protein
MSLVVMLSPALRANLTPLSGSIVKAFSILLSVIIIVEPLEDLNLLG